MSLSRWLAAGCLAAGLLASRVASAACPAIATCGGDPVPGCCSGNTCTLTGAINLSSTTCDLNFGARNVIIAPNATLNVGSGTLTIEAGSFRVNGGLIDAHGSAGNAGGNVTITTTGGGAPGYAFRLDGGGATGITVAGFGRGGGSLRVDADGPVTLAGGRIDATASEASAGGGSILIESTAGTMTIGAPVLADGQLSGFGGFVSLQTAGDLTVTDAGRITALSGFDGGSISLTAGGALFLSGAGLVRADGLNNSGDTGGEVDLIGGSVQIAGAISAQGGGDVSRDAGGDGGVITVEARTGSLVLATAAGIQALTADGAGGGDGGEIDLITDSPTNGDVHVDSVLSAHGVGGIISHPGGGGTIQVDSAGNFEMSRPIDVSGIGGATGLADITAQRDTTVNANILGSDPAGGGSLSLAAGHDVVLDGGASVRNVRMAATTNGPGGEIDISAGNDVRITSFQLDVSALGASQAGGSISADAGRNFTVDQSAVLTANSANDAAGSIELTAGLPDLAGNLQIDGQVTANGHAAAQAVVPASILLTGCQVSLLTHATVSSTGDPGTFNRVTGRSGISVFGTLRATVSNAAVFPSNGTPPSVTGTVQPAFTPTQPDPCNGIGPNGPTPPGCLMPCPTCGDNTAQFPEQCDPPGCPTCDLHCRTIACNTGNSCATDSCDATFGCVSEPMADGTGCSDGNPCTHDDICHTGICAGAPVVPAVDCDDGNVCTRDECSAARGGCFHTPVVCTAPSLCFTDPTCDVATGCGPGTPVPCNPGMVCDPGTGTCVQKPCPHGAADCDDSNPCTADTCTGGVCNSTPLDGVTPGCGDANPCNGTETCVAGACTPGAPPSCDDSNLCTVDTCNAVTGCQHTGIPGCCRDVNDCPGHNVCTVCDAQTHTCDSIADCCIAGPDCDDGNPCTADACGANNRCTHTNVDGIACSDTCHPGSTCQGGSCVVAAPLQCPPDPDVCHPFRCDPVAGACVNPGIDGCCRNDGDCDDHDNCTTDRCTDGHQCTNDVQFAGCKSCATDLDCDPLGACAGKQCGPGGVCIDVPAPECDNRRPNFRGTCALDGNGAPTCQYQCLLAAACDDGNACNGTETCSAGSCVAGTALDCDDHDVCTDDSCDPATGCKHDQKTGFASVVCRLDTMDAALGAAGPADVSPATARKLTALIGKARAKLSAAQAVGHGKAALKALKATGKQLKTIAKAVRAAVKSHKIKNPALADALTQATTDGGSALETLKAAVVP